MSSNENETKIETLDGYVERLSVTVTREQREGLERIAAGLDRSLAWTIRLAILQLLQDHQAEGSVKA